MSVCVCKRLSRTSARANQITDNEVYVISRKLFVQSAVRARLLSQKEGKAKRSWKKEGVKEKERVDLSRSNFMMNVKCLLLLLGLPVELVAMANSKISNRNVQHTELTKFAISKT